MWGQEHFVGEHPPPDLSARIDAATAVIAAARWWAITPVSLGRRWAIETAASTAREVFGALVRAHGYERPVSAPYLIVERVTTPTHPRACRHDLDSVHAEHHGVVAGDELTLVLEDWFYLPAVSPGPPELLQPWLVTSPDDAEPSVRWRVHVAVCMVFDDGWTLKADALDIDATEIRAVGTFCPWAGARELDRATADPATLALRETDLAGRFAPNKGFSSHTGQRFWSPKFYVCPHCGRRTRIDPRRLVPDVNWIGPASVFPEVLKARFDTFRPVPRWSYDFICKGCQRPVRLLYDYTEQGMGGPWSPVVGRIIETEA